MGKCRGLLRLGIAENRGLETFNGTICTEIGQKDINVNR